MELTLKRTEFNQTNTIGQLYINNEFYCDVLEDKDRGLNKLQSKEQLMSLKIKHETAIPYGVYEVIISHSPRFKRALPLLLNVPVFEGIRIHPGNTEADSSGCLLVGNKVGSKIINSKSTFNKLYKLLLATLLKEKIYIEITT
jgi:hypothetical protein